MITPSKRVKMAGNVDSTDISEAIKHFQIPSNLTVEGVEVPISLVQLVDGTKRPIPFVSGSAPWGNGIPSFVNDIVTNDSDKSYTVPVGKIWSLKFLYGEIVTTATVGNRVLVAQITDGTNPIWTNKATASIVASKRGIVRSSFGGSIALLSTPRRILSGATDCDVISDTGEPEILLPAGYTIRIWDVAAVDPAADDLTVVLHYVEYDA